MKIQSTRTQSTLVGISILLIVALLAVVMLSLGSLRLSVAKASNEGLQVPTPTPIYVSAPGACDVGLNIFGTPQVELWISKSAQQSLVNATDTAITWDTENVDTDDMFDSVVSNTNINIPVSGLYMVSLVGNFEPHATNDRVLYGVDNLGNNFVYNSVKSVGTLNPTTISSSNLIYLAEGQFFRIRAWQNRGGALNFRPTIQGLAELHVTLISLNEP